MRLVYLFLLLFFLGSPTLSQDLSVEAHAAEVADRIKFFYDELGPQAGCILYDPCYVLTLAELRPHARWNGFKAKDPEVRQAFLDLNTIGNPLGFDFKVSERGGLTIRSLNGLAGLSQRKDFPWLEPFPQDGSFDDWQKWVATNGKRAEEYVASEGFEGEDLAGHFMEGFLLGYPEVAVRCYMVNSHDPYHHKRAINVGVAFRQHLDNGEPSYDILPEDCLDPQISEHVRKWSHFLSTFYELPGVRNRLRSDRFQEARRRAQPRVAHSDTERWWRGDQLSSIWRNGGFYLTRSHEIVLYRHIDELETLIALGKPPQELILACQRWAFEDEDSASTQFSGSILEQWFWWGAWSKKGPRGRFYRAVSSVQPKLFESESRYKIKEMVENKAEGRERSEWELREAALLYRHPEFQNVFPSLSPEEKNFVISDIRDGKKRKEFRELIEEIKASAGNSVFQESLK